MNSLAVGSFYWQDHCFGPSRRRPQILNIIYGRPLGVIGHGWEVLRGSEVSPKNAQIPENCTFTIGHFDGHRGLKQGRKLITNLLDWNLPIASVNSCTRQI